MSKDKLKTQDIEDALYELSTDEQVGTWTSKKTIGFVKLLEKLDTLCVLVQDANATIEMNIQDVDDDYLLKYDVKTKTVAITKLIHESKSDSDIQ
jgi:hypothetical protein